MLLLPFSIHEVGGGSHSQHAANYLIKCRNLLRGVVALACLHLKFRFQSKLDALLKRGANNVYPGHLSCRLLLRSFCLYRIRGGMYPLGYSAPEPQTLLHPTAVPAPKKYMNDASLQLTHEQQMWISHKVAQGEFPAKLAGRSGECLFLTRLRYTDANNLFLVPAAHALLHGLVKDFWNRVLEKVCPDADYQNVSLRTCCLAHV